MVRNYLTIALRNLRTNKTLSFINIAGFAFGISICLGIAAYIIHENSFDRFYTHSDRIYRLYDAKNNVSPVDYRIRDIIKRNFPEVENACLYQQLSRPLAVTVSNRGRYVENVVSADNAFFEVFGIQALGGDIQNPLTDLNSAVLTESTARMLFGNDDPIGKEIDLHRVTVRVTAVIKDFPDNATLQPRMILNADNENFKFSFSCGNSDDKTSYRWPFEIYLLLREHSAAGALAGKLHAHAELLRPFEESLGMQPLTDIYLQDKTQGSGTRSGNPGLLSLLLGIGSIILVLAVINYANLTAAQQHKRCKEIGVKKSLGAGRGDILGQFLVESVVITFLSFLIAIGLLIECIPLYRSIFYDTFQIHQLFSYWYVIIPAVCLIGLASGAGTALYFSSLRTVSALKGESFVRRGRFAWRNGLTVFQFIISIALVVCIIVMQTQIRYMKHSYPGFDREQLLRVDVPQLQLTDKNNVYRFVDQVRHYPGIAAVSVTNGVPGIVNMHMGANMPGKSMSLPIIHADSAFLPTFGIHIVRGRSPMPGDYGATCLINESAYQYFEWTDLQDKRYDNGRPGGFQVVGVVNDFHYSSLRDAIGPMCILFPDEVYPTHLSIRMGAGRIGETMHFIEQTWREVLPQYPLQYEFYDSWLEAMYRNDEKIGTAIGLFGALAIVISCLGILGMAIVSTQRRTKEIGIRKVVGASVANILVMLTRNLALWVLTANVLAWPIAYYAMTVWLQNFAYRIEIQWWMFVAAGGLALLIALLTVGMQAIKAAMANPVDALRYE